MFGPLTRLVDDHAKAWSALGQAAAEVVQLPIRSVQRLLDPDAPELADPLAVAQARIEQLDRELARERGQAVQAEQLRIAYARLELTARDGAQRAIDDQKLALYKVLEPLLTQLPIVRHAVSQGRTVEAADLLDLLGPLDEALASLGFARIGEIGAEVAFDPARHQVIGASPEAGATVMVKHPGWALEDRILRRARVGPLT